VWAGTVFAALTLAVLAWGYGLYVAAFGSSSAAGAAGTIVLGIAFIYYSAQTLLFGAEIINARAQRRGRPSARISKIPREATTPVPDDTGRRTSPPRRGGSQALPSIAAASPETLILRLLAVLSSR
jgi:uncharacterized BrkB/YihY/UPF0761 family membrane protein